jgi:hypothetical protein
MAIHIGRRKFITTLSSAVAWPLAARTQQTVDRSSTAYVHIALADRKN